MMNRLITLKRF